MTEDHSEPDSYEAVRRYVPLAIWAIVLLVLLFIPLKIIQFGYLPPDDALRHAAKAVSHKDWPDILVLSKAYYFDPNWGWHWFLHQCHVCLNWNAEALVVFSVVMLFVTMNWSIVSCLRRPEAWLASIILVSLVYDMTHRMLLGRPFVLSILVIGMILLLWQRSGPAPPRWQNLFWITPLIALAVFLHGCWYLWALPIAAFFLAQQFRWCFLLATGWVLGTFLGSALTGHPIDSILQAIQLAFGALGKHKTQLTLVSELQPTGGDINTLFALGGLVVFRQLWKFNAPPLLRHPAFWLAGIGWVLGCHTSRFWEDWGTPALMVLIASDLDLFLQSRMAADSFRRLALAGVLAVMCYSVTTADAGSRWTNHLTWQYLDPKDPQNKDLKGWMPDQGGILYAADMGIFYHTFFKNPDGDWRYILGFESTLMPDEDFEIYKKILWNFGDTKAYEPWVKKLQPPDRLVIPSARSAPPAVPQLEWNYPVTGIWIGRTPRPVEEGTAPPMVRAKTEGLTNFVPAAVSPK